MFTLLPALAAAAPYAVVIGTDTPPPGRVALRYAASDARAVQDVLLDVGGFTPADVVLLVDPTPEEVLAAIAAAPPDLDQFLLYYSGHADDSALYPSGRRLPIAELKLALDDVDADLRLGVVDACRGGGWTGAKGVTAVEPFEVSLASSGTAYVAASSGAEDAHELEVLGGSIFTHHWTSGLRGAADTDMDAVVTLGESFDWARSHTVRDSALLTGKPQHPSFHLDVHGRSDLVLSDLRGARSSVSLFWGEGEVEVFALDSGVHVADLDRPPSVLVLPPGRYAARRTHEDRVVDAAEFVVAAGAPTTIEPEDFVRLAPVGLVAQKGDELAPIHRMSPYAGRFADQISIGSWVGESEDGLARHFLFRSALQVGLTDRLALSFPNPGLAYAFGAPGRLEVLAFGGFYEGGLELVNADDRVIVGLIGGLGGGLDLRAPVSERAALVGSSWASSDSELFHGGDFFGPLRVGFGIGAEVHVGPAVTLRPGVGVEQELGSDPGTVPRLGGALRRGVRQLPLLQVAVSSSLSLDFDLGFAFDETGGTVQETLIGISVLDPPRARNRDR